MGLSAEMVQLPQEGFSLIFDHLDKHEREHLALEVMDIIRRDIVDLMEMQRLFDNWYMTAWVRSHPDFDRQFKEFKRLNETGEGFAGLDPALVAEVEAANE